MFFCFLGWFLAVAAFATVTWLSSSQIGFWQTVVVYACLVALVAFIYLVAWLIGEHCSTCFLWNLNNCA